MFYQQGFCYHGTECRYRHYKQPAEKRPVIGDFSLGVAQGRNFMEAAHQRRRPDLQRPMGAPGPLVPARPS